jgi:hypothetical protein
MGRALRLLSLLAVVVVLFVSARAEAAQPARVLVFRADPPSPVLEEALLRVRGELAAVGLLVEVRPIEEAPRGDTSVAQGTYGVLVLDQSANLVRIRAYSPDSAVPVEQQVDSTDPHVDPEVIAVRAVETLRAVMLEYARRARDKDEELPAPVSGFTRIGPAKKKEPPLPPQMREAERASRPTPVRPWLELRVGPDLSLDTTALAPSAGLSAAVRLHPDLWFLELGAGTTLLPAKLSRAAGDVDVERSMLDLRAGMTFRPSLVFEVSWSAGGGVASYGVSGRANAGYVGRSERHVSPLFTAVFGCALWPSQNLGAYASALSAFPLDAPRVRVAAEDVATAKQPELGGSIGLAARL